MFLLTKSYLGLKIGESTTVKIKLKPIEDPLPDDLQQWNKINPPHGRKNHHRGRGRQLPRGYILPVCNF